MITPVQDGKSNLATANHDFDKYSKIYTETFVYHENIKRAATIVYILVKQEQACNS